MIYKRVINSLTVYHIRLAQTVIHRHYYIFWTNYWFQIMSICTDYTFQLQEWPLNCTSSYWLASKNTKCVSERKMYEKCSLNLRPTECCRISYIYTYFDYVLRLFFSPTSKYCRSIRSIACIQKNDCHLYSTYYNNVEFLLRCWQKRTACWRRAAGSCA